jgi:hypothetical protein
MFQVDAQAVEAGEAAAAMGHAGFGIPMLRTRDDPRDPLEFPPPCRGTPLSAGQRHPRGQDQLAQGQIFFPPRRLAVA